MSLHNLPTTITPTEHEALGDLLELIGESVRESTQEDLKRTYQLATRWHAAQGEAFFQEWACLQDGSHLKAAYEDMVWKWSDRDLEAMGETDLNFIKGLDIKPERPFEK